MATRKHFAHDIAQRARKIGWLVNIRNYGYEITCPDYFKVQIHMTPSDVNHSRTVMRELNKHGFDEAEKDFAKLTEQERQRKMNEAAQKAQQSLEKAQREADLLSRAAGQQRVSEDVILTPVSMPKTFERVLVTPELASKILERNTKNRPLRIQAAHAWKNVIRSGFWRYTHQGVAIDSNGVLQDGQHRLTGIVLADVPCEMQVSIGMPPENFQTIDNGMKRTYGDIATNLGYKSGSRIGSAARLLIIMDDLPERSWSSAVNNVEMGQFLSEQFDEEQNNGQVLQETVMVGQNHWTSYRINGSAVAAGTFLLWKHVGKNHPKVVSYLEGLRSGVDLSEKDPRRLLVRYAMNPNRPRINFHHLALFLKAWNLYGSNNFTKRHLSFRKDEEMPKLYIP